MRRLWTKFVVASLIILGEGAFASEISQRTDDRHENVDNPAVISQSVIPADSASSYNPVASFCNDGGRPQITLTHYKAVVVSVLTSGSFEYNPFSPRAPPVPAS